MMITRRGLLYSAAAAAQVPPSSRIRVGVIGSGGRGTLVMSTMQKVDPAVRVGAVCDVYEPNLERAVSVAAKAQGGESPRIHRRYQDLLNDKSIDAVLIATPEHWHHRMVLDALAAGKDIYVEKPLCQTPEQGLELVAAEQRTKQIVQVGMQRRSYDLYIEARKVVAEGALGNVRMVRSWWLNTQLAAPPVAPKLEGALDWEQWQGPAAKRGVDASRFRYWRLYQDYAGGIVADQGAHVFDGIHMLMNAGYPVAVTAAAGRVHKPGVDTPESVVVTAEYAEDFIGVFTINYAAMRYQSRNDQMNHLDGDRARMDIGREEYLVRPAGDEDHPVRTGKSARGFGHATDLHVADFLECVRTRRRPRAPMALGFQATLVTQLANRSLREGRRIEWKGGA